MQYLLLARHGNTFAPEQKVVWVGARNDLPLVESGLNQAKALAQVLQEFCLLPQATYAASLKRTVVYAQIICDQLHLKESVNIDSRLNEIDYGNWSGLSSDEINIQFENNELDEWNKYGQWPKSFVGKESDIERDVKHFVQDVIEKKSDNKIVLAITSNGRLKYFLKLIPDIYVQYIEQNKWKVGTGQVCILGYDKTGWQLICWNENPLQAFNIAFPKVRN